MGETVRELVFTPFIGRPVEGLEQRRNQSWFPRWSELSGCSAGSEAQGVRMAAKKAVSKLLGGRRGGPSR